jgi:hypothetical protein
MLSYSSCHFGVSQGASHERDAQEALSYLWILHVKQRLCKTWDSCNALHLARRDEVGQIKIAESPNKWKSTNGSAWLLNAINLYTISIPLVSQSRLFETSKQ